MSDLNCIRDCADHRQILRCRELLNLYSGDLTAQSSILNLAGNEVRFKILFLLSKESELCVCDLSDILEMKIPAVSQHLRKMKDRQIIFPRKEGQTIFYTISEGVKPLLEMIFETLQPQKIAV